MGNRKNKIIIVIIVMLLAIFLIILIFNGIFDSNVSSHFYVIGNVNEPFLGNGSNDYVINFLFSSKGAFIANKKVNVQVEILINNDSVKRNTFFILFNGASNYIEITKPACKNKFEFDCYLNQLLLSENNSFKGNMDLLYSVGGDFEPFNIVVSNGSIPSMPQFRGTNYIVFPNSIIHIANLEDTAQIELNNLILMLSVFIGAFTIIQVLFELLRD